MTCIRKLQLQSSGYIWYALLVLPAILAGVLAMIYGGVSTAVWGQQVAVWAVFALLTDLMRRIVKRVSETAWLILFLLMLGATLMGTEVEGVKRWLDLGFLNINAAMLVLPALLSILNRAKHPHPFILSAAFVLSFQPDLSQLTALSIAVLPLLWQEKVKRLWTIGSVAALGLLVGRALITPTMLQPVLHCEGIFELLGKVSPWIKAVGCISLMAIPVYFLYLFLHQRKIHLLSLAVYYAVSMLFIFSGEYPVPFVGFGLSPIAGYYLAYICTTEGVAA